MIKNIWAVGRNYADHAKELGNPLPIEPLFFLKAGSCIQHGSTLFLAQGLGEVHHEVELALRFDASLNLKAFTVALDLTDRTAQQQAKQSGLPWTKAKSFRGACVISEWLPFKDSEDFYRQDIELKVNGAVRQKCSLTAMIFKPKDLLPHLKAVYPVEPGDILLTGTPQGVGRLQHGDFIETRIGSQLSASWEVVEE